MPPAVLRTIAPRPTASTPSAVRNSAVPTTTRSASGSPSACSTWWPAHDRLDGEEARRTRRPASARTSPARRRAILAHSTGSRRGTAIRLERIMPVEYSPVMTITPSTPTASCARCQPPTPASIDVVASRARAPRRARPAAHLNRRDQHAQAGHRRRRPPAATSASIAGSQLRPLRPQHLALGDPAGAGDGRAAATALMPPAPRVGGLGGRAGTRRRRRSGRMYASSSEACCGVSSCSTNPRGRRGRRCAAGQPAAPPARRARRACIADPVAGEGVAQPGRLRRAHADRRVAGGLPDDLRRPSCRRSAARAR